MAGRCHRIKMEGIGTNGKGNASDNADDVAMWESRQQAKGG